MPRDLDAVAGPGGEFLRRQDLAQRRLGPIEVLLEAGGETRSGRRAGGRARQPREVAAVSRMMLGGGRWFIGGGYPECLAMVRVGSVKLPISTASVSVSSTA